MHWSFAMRFVKTLTVCSLLLATRGGQGAEPPNFVVVLVDDLGYTDVGIYGSSFYETPNVDRLAASGIRFTDGYAAHPVCSPTRAAIMTGKNPARLHISDWIPGLNPKDRKLLGPDDEHQLALEEVTIAERLKQAGYTTFFAGKWHLGGEGFFPEDQGFDINVGGHHRGSPPGGYYSPYENPKLPDGPKDEYLPDRLTNEAIRFIEDHQDERFLVYLSFYTVHTPIQASKRHIEKYLTKRGALPPLDGPGKSPEHDGLTRERQDDAAYASMVEAMDENLGRLLSKLEELKLDTKTVVIFTSDNGGLSTLEPRRLAPTSNRPLRAGKGWCYEGGIRVPFILRVPGISKSGSTSAVPVTSADLYPTILELAGLPLDDSQHADSLSLVPVLKGEHELPREYVVWHFPHYHGSTWTPGSAIRAGPWKLIDFYDKEKIELYNLADDVGESRDLSKAMPDKAAELRKLLRDYLGSVDAQMPKPNPDANEP
jgi:arylsulfatase A-like enzyme